MALFKIATWNVNSLSVRLEQVLAWLASEQPEVLALQETKLTDDRFPASAIKEAGYHAVYSGQKAYNGVALISRTPASEVVFDIPGLPDPQRRVLGASWGGLRILNIYVPNGESVGSEKYSYKLNWLSKLCTHIEQQIAGNPHLVVLGDFNIAPEERDVYDPQLWEGRVLFSGAERAAFQKILGAGLCDTFRLFEQPERQFSWWDYRMGGFRRNHGLRIDHILASRALCQRCRSCRIDRGPRALERPSDHTPVVAEFDLG
ncbi:MAG: exodeoxyribonuclease III [Gammaproteobacteria bacterium]|nr:exodeoxyribonuclease III [Gammaproteobacteria bacterium]